MPNAVIANGQTVSGAVKVRGEVVGLIMPSAFTGTAITFQSKDDAGTYQPVHDAAGVAVSVTVAPNRHIRLAAGTLAGVRDLKIVSGTAEGAQRTVILVLK